MGAFQAVEASYNIQYHRWGREQTKGSGVFGDVRPCTHQRTHALRAVKSIEKVDWGTRGRVLTEIRLLQTVGRKHPNVIEYVEYYEEWGVMNLIFEYCAKGSLGDLMELNKPPSEGVAASYLSQLLSAVAFLEDLEILHRDVKPDNLLLKDELTLKLADFGSACFCTQPLRHAEGTPSFWAPEQHLLPRGKGYSFPVDAWATGVTMYMLLFNGRHPFEDKGAISRQLIFRGQIDVGWLTSSGASDLLRWLLMPNANQRIAAKDAQGHPWFHTHGVGHGTFAKQRPKPLVLDSYGNWHQTRD